MRVGFWNREPLADVSFTPQRMRCGALGWHPCLPGAVFRIRSWPQGRLGGCRSGGQAGRVRWLLPLYLSGPSGSSWHLSAFELCPLRQQARAAPTSSRLVPTLFQGTLPGAGTAPSSQGPSGC